MPWPHSGSLPSLQGGGVQGYPWVEEGASDLGTRVEPRQGWAGKEETAVAQGGS